MISNIDFTKAFDKQFIKLSAKKQKQVKDAIGKFIDNNQAPSLRLHGLKGKWQGHYSISVGGDLRLHFRLVDDTTALFIAVGSHSQLYK